LSGGVYASPQKSHFMRSVQKAKDRSSERGAVVWEARRDLRFGGWVVRVFRRFLLAIEGGERLDWSGGQELSEAVRKGCVCSGLMDRRWLVVGTDPACSKRPDDPQATKG